MASAQSAKAGGPAQPHDRALFDRVIALVRRDDPEVRSGTMFGCPAAYAAGKMAFCVFGADLGVKLPPLRADALIAAGSATSFQPYGRRRMPGWVQIAPGALHEPELIAILLEAASHVRKAVRG